MHSDIQKEMGDLFEKHHRQAYDAHQLLQNQPQQIVQEQQVQPIQQQQMIQPMGQQMPNQNQQSYKYARSFSKSFKVDQNGNVVGSSDKMINDNGRTFREEKQFDSATNKMYVKRHKPDGTVNEFEKPFPKSHRKYLQ